MSEQEEQLLLSALVAFSDSCTIPKLTPACPYYRCVDDRPTCGEECRTLLTSMGVDRSAQDFVVAGGLLMRGTAMPIEVARGYQPYDATRHLLEEQDLPISQQSTGTLLLQLRSHAVEPPGMRARGDDHFFDLWGELTQRGLPVEGVLRAAIAPEMAKAVLRVLKAGIAYGFPEWQKCYKAGQTMSELAEDAYDRWFVDHVAEWFARLLETDSQGFLTWKASPAPLLANLPGLLGDDEGRWIWDRFTRARPEDWATRSLIHEWRHIAGSAESESIRTRTLNARTVEPDRVAEAVMSRMAGVQWGPMTPPDLSADQFVARALELLEKGRPEEAADIFAALVVVHPGDGDAQNNLGFCLLPTDPRTASKVLDRASALPSKRKAITTANRAFAKHLLGDDEGALSLLEMAKQQADDRPVMMWVETKCRSFGVRHQDSIAAYADQLAVHIQAASLSPSDDCDDS